MLQGLEKELLQLSEHDIATYEFQELDFSSRINYKLHLKQNSIGLFRANTDHSAKNKRRDSSHNNLA